EIGEALARILHPEQRAEHHDRAVRRQAPDAPGRGPAHRAEDLDVHPVRDDRDGLAEDQRTLLGVTRHPSAERDEGYVRVVPGAMLAPPLPCAQVARPWRAELRTVAASAQEAQAPAGIVTAARQRPHVAKRPDDGHVAYALQ